MVEVYLLLGGNLGNRFQLQDIARDLIHSQIGRVDNESSFYETEPWGFTHEQNFLNKVVKISTLLKPEEVLDKIHEIESHLGRIRKKEQYSERTIDIDILFYGSEIIETERLNIPHLQFPNRKFAIAPMKEIAPNYIHPGLSKNITEIDTACKDSSIVQKLNYEMA